MFLIARILNRSNPFLPECLLERSSYVVGSNIFMSCWLQHYGRQLLFCLLLQLLFFWKQNSNFPLDNYLLHDEAFRYNTLPHPYFPTIGVCMQLKPTTQENLIHLDIVICPNIGIYPQKGQSESFLVYLRSRVLGKPSDSQVCQPINPIFT